MKRKDFVEHTETIRTESMEWALKQLAAALNYAHDNRNVSLDLVWDQFFEPPVFSLDLSPETKAVVMQLLYRFA